MKKYDISCFPAKLLMAALSALLMCLFTSCGKTSEEKQNLEKITVAQAGDFLIYLPLYLADDMGFFKAEGISVKIMTTGGDDKTFAAVIGGSATFGVADPTFVAIAREKGMQGRIVAGLVGSVPLFGVAIKPSIPEINNPSLLKGLSVATYSAPSTAYVLQEKMYKDAGLPPISSNSPWEGRCLP